MNETYVTIKGRLTRRPHRPHHPAGAPMTKFRIAQSARRQVPGQPGQWEDTEPSFYDVVTYRSLAANIAVSLRRGHPVTVHGRQRIVSWRRDDGSTLVRRRDRGGCRGARPHVRHHRVRQGRDGARRGVVGVRVTAPVAQAGRPDDGRGPAGHLGDPERDPYVVDAGPGRGWVRRASAGRRATEAADGDADASGDDPAPGGARPTPGRCCAPGRRQRPEGGRAAESADSGGGGAGR